MNIAEKLRQFTMVQFYSYVGKQLINKAFKNSYYVNHQCVPTGVRVSYVDALVITKSIHSVTGNTIYLFKPKVQIL